MSQPTVSDFQGRLSKQVGNQVMKHRLRMPLDLSKAITLEWMSDYTLGLMGNSVP